MSSIIEGYNYDIFISYRQKDNKGDRWVSEFVDSLKTELESTFKEEISVYFDINPHDGLLETHDVDASLKDKLKCLVFIPIISRTYCDPKSFAWEHEFKAFVDLASKDQFGLKVKLPNGNVASRVLPIRIHDLDIYDTKLCESVLGGVLRGVEFIYREPGVDRPLTAKDNEEKNLNKTNYRNQINKVALGIRDIITALGKHEQKSEEISKEVSVPVNVRQEKNKIKIIVGSLILVSSIVLGYFIVKGLFKSEKELEKSIAVLPFDNWNSDAEYMYLGDAISDEIILELQNINDFDRILSRSSTMQFREKRPSIPEIAEKLGVNYIIEGSIQRQKDNVLIRVQVIRAKREDHIWANEYKGKWEDILIIQEDIAKKVAEELKIALTPSEIEQIEKKPTENLEAYNYYIRGNDYMKRYNLSPALEMFSKAILADSTYAEAYAKRARLNLSKYWTRQGVWQNHYLKAQQDIKSGLRLNPESPELRLVQAYACYVTRDFDKALGILGELKAKLPKMADLYQLTADVSRRQGNWDASINERLIAVKMDPFNWTYLTDLATTYGLLRQYDKQIECYREGLLLFPNMDFNQLLFNAFLHKTGDLELTLQGSGVKKENVQYSVFYYTRQYDKQIELIREDDSINTGLTNFLPKTFRLALIYYLNGNKSLCKIYSDSAVVLLKSRINETPEDERLYATLGKCFALLGKYDEAVKNGQKSVELMPVKVDAFQGSYMEKYLMETYILSKNYNKAIEKMEYLLSIPSDVHIGDILIDPIFDNLRSLPRFQKIIENARK